MVAFSCLQFMEILFTNSILGDLANVDGEANFNCKKKSTSRFENDMDFQK